MNKKVITIIFKDGNTGTFESCIDCYEMHDTLLVYYKTDDHIMHYAYQMTDVACVVEGYIEKVDLDR